MPRHDWQIKPDTTPLIIIGMHRSGTSMLARLINLMGAEIGNHLVKPLPNDNETGFWEHQHIVDLNEELLKHFGTWHLGVTDLPADYLSRKPAQETIAKLSGILRRDFAHHAYWVIKDPRISRLMPLWQQLFSELNGQPHWIIPVRHPAEVADSLVKRNNISRERALLLWLKYNLEVEKATRGQPRAFVHYPDLLQNPEATMQQLAQHLAITLRQSYKKVAKEVNAFIQPSLHHNKASDTTYLPNWAGIPYRVLKDAASTGEADSTALDSIAEDVRTLLSPVQEDVQKILLSNEQQNKDIEDLSRHLELLQNSLSWQITRPVRFSKKAIKWALGKPDNSRNANKIDTSAKS